MKKIFTLVLVLVSMTVGAREPLPKYEESRHLLPKVIFDGKREYVELYDQTWKMVFNKLMSPPSGSPLVSNWIDEGLSPQIFQWDTNLAIMFGRYADHIFPFIESHDNFYALQHEDGMICRVINENDGTDHYWGLGVDNARAINPPLYSWVEWENYLVTGDKSRFGKIIPVLEKYGEYIEKNRRGHDTPHRLYWSNGQASGMDNTPRDIGRPEPGDGWDCHSAIDHVGWVDMSSQMVLFYRYLSYICGEAGCADKKVVYEEKADEIAFLINKWMWDEERGLYFDVDTNGQKTKWVTVATFWPMLAGVSDAQQSRRLVENMLDPELFWRQVPLPTLAYNQELYNPTGCYWRGGVWAPTNYMAVQALSRNGYEKEATQLASRFLNAIFEVYKQTETIWEVYSPEAYMPSTNASGVYMCMRDFTGWTALAPISMLIENIIGIKADADSGKIVWNITQDCRHGIEGLRFNGVNVSLVATPCEGKGFSISVECDRELSIELRYDNKIRFMDVSSGKTEIRI